ncbi:hypothetical protein DN546_32560, partial [Burkholderia multivorans]
DRSRRSLPLMRQRRRAASRSIFRCSSSGLVTSAKATSTTGKTATRTGAELRSSLKLKSASFTMG